MWASLQIGQKKSIDPQKSQGPQGESFQFGKKDDWIVMPSDWGAIPKADFDTEGIVGWYLSPEPVGAFSHRIPGKELRAEIPSPDKTLIDFDRRPSMQQELYEMTEKEHEKFWKVIELEMKEVERPGQQEGPGLGFDPDSAPSDDMPPPPEPPKPKNKSKIM